MARARIHPTAIVEPGVVLGDDTAVWDGVHIRGPALIGRECIIGEKTYIAYGVTIGDRVKINAHVYLCTGVTLERGVMIAAGVIFTNDRYPRACDPDTGELATSEPTEDTLHTVVHEGATIGAGCVIGPGLEIGRYAMIGMGSVLAGHVPQHALVFGNPARLRGYVCVCGSPLVDWSEHDEPVRCRRCGRAFEVTAEGSDLHLHGGHTA